MRVAVVGAGAAGGACAWRLLSGRKREGLSVTVLEMGRGAGGRAGTRHVPELPGLRVNHGAPLFHVPAADVETRPLISALLQAGHLAEWRGTHGSFDMETGASGAGGASRGEPAADTEAFARYRGAPAMSSVARGCLELAREASGGALETHFATRVRELRPKKAGDAIVGWEVLDKDGKNFGVFDWVVVSGATPALARWRAGFKEEPPVYQAAQDSGSKLMRDLVARLDPPLEYEQTHVALLAWNVSDGGGAADEVLRSLRMLPFDITMVKNDEALKEVALQSSGPQYAIVALHSTNDFARKHKKVMGSGSYVSVSNNVEGSVDSEAIVSQELFEALQRLLARRGAPPLPPPAWGPKLHRWGAAFPEPDLGALGAEKAWVVREARFVFAGDFLAGPPHASVATALRSGLAAGEAILDAAHGVPAAPTALEQLSAL